MFLYHLLKILYFSYLVPFSLSLPIMEFTWMTQTHSQLSQSEICTRDTVRMLRFRKESVHCPGR